MKTDLPRPSRTGSRRHEGAVLFTCLMLLLILMLLGLAGAQMTVLQEKMAGSFKNQADAFQASERRLTDAERKLLDVDLRAGIASTRVAADGALPWWPWYVEGPPAASEKIERLQTTESAKFGVDPARDPKLFVVSGGAPGKDDTAKAAVQSIYVH